MSLREGYHCCSVPLEIVAHTKPRENRRCGRKSSIPEEDTGTSKQPDFLKQDSLKSSQELPDPLFHPSPALYRSRIHRAKGRLPVKAGETAFKTWIDSRSPSTRKSEISVFVFVFKSCARIPDFPQWVKREGPIFRNTGIVF